VVSLVSILGDNNGIATGNEWAHGDWGAASYIEQLGTNNKITLSSIEGSNNHAPNPWAPGAFNRVHEIIQKGSNNGLVASTASTLGSDYNWIKVYEEGSGNNFSVTQGISLDSTHNFATVNQIGNDNGATFSQLGSFNTASTSQDGNGNLITIQQISDGNTATTSFVGDENGTGSFTGGAVGTLIAAHPGKLVQGTIEQDSTGFATGNLVEYDVVGSENLFAFTQEGGNNKIFGGVGDTGDASSFNEAAVLQVGANNTTSFSQMGGSNILAVAQ
jgi:hypothetical protein